MSGRSRCAARTASEPLEFRLTECIGSPRGNADNRLRQWVAPVRDPPCRRNPEAATVAQRSLWTTSSKGRRFGVRIGASGRSAG